MNKIYFRGLSAKSNKSIYSRGFSSEIEAIKDAIKRQKAGKIVQAEFWDSTISIGHKLMAFDLDTKGIVKRYNPEKKRFERLTTKGWVDY